MKTLLVATDLSARSDQAIVRAIALAGQMPAKVTIVHVAGDSADAAKNREVEVKNEIAGQLAHLPVGQTQTSVRVLAGKHVEAIFAAAQEEAADLLVIGKHRAVEDIGVFRGSTGERMIRFGTRSVLLVKTEAVSRPYQKIVVGVDFSPSSRSAVEFALDMFPKAEFILVHAYPAPRVAAGIAERLDAQFTEFMHGLGEAVAHCSQLSREGPPVPTVLKAIAAINPDLVVMGTHGRTGSGPMQIGTVAERVLSESACDVLAVRA